MCLKILALLFLSALLSSCTNYPSEADARKVFENQRQQQLKSGLISIVSFKKVNAQSREVFGVKIYQIEYEAEINWPKGLNSHCDPSRFTGWDCWMVGIHKVGETQKVHSKMAFEKTEKGWRGPDGNIY